MKNQVLIEFYNKHFNGIIPYKPDGRIRDYLSDMLPYYLKNLAIQEMMHAGHKVEGSKGHFSKETEEELSYIVSCLRNEIQMNTNERCISRIKRRYTFGDEELDPNISKEEISKMVEDEKKKPDFQMLCYELDFYNDQLLDYIRICDRHGVATTVEFDDDIVITKRV